MTGHHNIIDELESALANKAVDSRAEMLRCITDLFVVGASNFSAEQIELFDTVMCRLIDEIEKSTLEILSTQLVAIPNAPPRTVRKLALNDSIDVAGAMLAKFGRLDDETLVEGANTKSQDHLLAISIRPSLSEAVTDVLVVRGNQHVAISTAGNPGARFSESGYSRLVMRSEHDGNLAHRIWRRPDVPRQHLLTLFATASDTVRRELAAVDPRKTSLIEEMVARASDQIQADAREQSAEFKAAYSRIKSLYAAGKLSEARLLTFAVDGHTDEISIALALMCQLDVGVIERALVHRRLDQILVFSKSIDLTWETTKAILRTTSGAKGYSPHDLDQAAANFRKLKQETASKAIQFYRLQEQSLRGRSN